jgi:uncharacterized protein (TIGR02600 family)
MIFAPAPCSRPARQRGFVLILILVLIVLVSLLVIGFLGHSLSQVKTVTNYRAQTDSLLLSDAAVNLVKAQIDDATSQPASIWASQPGAIRTFSNSGSGNNGYDPKYGTIYKLYSSPALTSTSPQTDIPNDLPSAPDPAGADWNTSPSWTDLNAPVQKSDGTYAYPIIDAYNDPADLPGANFSASSALPPSFSVNTNTVGAVTPLSKTTPPTLYPIPMPVQWLYILKQGQIIAPDPGAAGSATITFNKATPKPSATNPVVGRVAYWTDDDTCRVNINTASVSGTAATGSSSAINTFWDTPHFTAGDDTALATSQPYNLEYQRYAGHPAMTTLALALPEFADPAGTGNVSVANMNSLLNLTPRYGTGGSNGATTVSSSQGPLTFKANSNGSPYRIYDSINELLFNAPGAVTSSPRNTSTLTRQQLETAKFFLTAHSRAPELNLYGMPRVAIWPISSQTGNQYRTATDNLIAFCATNNVGTTANGAGTYYFTREPYTSYNATPLKGSNSPTWDVSLARNVSLLGYLDTLTSSFFPVPGYLGGGQSFEGKYGKLPKRQILTEIFDYVRMTNARDPGLDPLVTTGGTPYAAATAYNSGQVDSGGGYGQIVPTNMTGSAGSTPLSWNTYGFGRGGFTLVNAGIIFVAVGQGPTAAVPPAPQTYTSQPFNATIPGSYTAVNQIQANQENYNVYPQNMDYRPTGGNNPLNPSAPSPPSPARVAPFSAANTPYNNIPPPGTTAVIAVFVYTFFDPALGYCRESSYLNTNTIGLGQNPNAGTTGLTVGPAAGQTMPKTQPLFVRENYERLANELGNAYLYDSYWGADPGNLGSLFDFRYPLAGRMFYYTDNRWYSSYSNIMNMPTGGSFVLNDGTFQFQIAGSGANTIGGPNLPVVHTYNFHFPKVTLPVPAYPTIPLIGTPGNINGVYAADRIWDIQDKYGAVDSKGQHTVDVIDFADDTVVSLIPTPAYGDYRMLSAPSTPATAFQPHPNYMNLSQSQRLAEDFMYPSGLVMQTTTTYASPSTTGTTPGINPSHGSLVSGASYYMTDSSTPIPVIPNNVSPPVYGSAPVVPVTVMNPSAGSSTSGGAPPDFDNGFGELPDGPFINKPDEGAVYPASSNNYNVYYDNAEAQVDSLNNPSFFFSPQRQVPSPVMFGSLPTGAPVGANAPKPWQTLLFQPGAPGHFGLNLPRDEYLLDLFWMPQASPYAISEPFSTAGKVNLNYQILPFTYIDRSTAVQSVLASEKVAQVAVGQAGKYKNYGASSTGGITGNVRLPLNLSETNGTLSQFANTFSQFSVFRSVAQICELYLVPQGFSWPADTALDPNSHVATNSAAQAAFYGSNFALVGDNTREKPYADLYSRLTTKSNVYTVYYRVQTLKNPPTVAPTQWTEGTGVITGEFRGSTTIERYLDPNLTVPDYGGMGAGSLLDSASLDGVNPASSGNQLYYKWRVVENNRFAP